ncbi:MAG: hypothetical protein VX290_12240 [Candidatus Latescibacterota bacterium]|nr:hypothetical protein [Candidatus Latescibacterota bacterium]MEE3263603.1 hypothetical protein [Candidatus Latescibacterota bacterium]
MLDEFVDLLHRSMAANDAVDSPAIPQLIADGLRLGHIVQNKNHALCLAVAVAQYPRRGQ